MNTASRGVDFLKVNAWGDLIPVLLLAVLSLAVGGGVGIVLVHRYHRKHQPRPALALNAWNLPIQFVQPRHSFLQRPVCWLCVRGRDLQAVQSAFDLHNPKPCTWLEGIAGEEKLFISPPVNGWILIFGPSLPEPSEDVDASFRFMLEVSRKLGRTQFFQANPALNHHAWVWAEAGRVVRAYAWAGRTLWNQGIKTRAELELGMKCFHYFEGPQRSIFGAPDILTANTERVPLLAGRWSLDPASIDERVFQHGFGIAGEPSRHY